MSTVFKACKSSLCDVCLQQQPKSAFSDEQLHNWRQNITHRCQECMICETCHQILGPKRFDGSSRICRKCTAPIQCIRCNEKRDPRAFCPEQIVKHSKDSKIKMLCTICIDQGFTLRDLKAYVCRSCRKTWGCNKYRAQDINRLQKKRLKTVVCDKCK